MKAKIKSLKKLSLCSTCGDKVVSGECLSCHNKYPEYNNILNSLIKDIENKEYSDIDIMYIYLIKDIEEIKNIIDDNIVEEIFRKQFEKIYTKIINCNLLNGEDEEVTKLLLKNMNMGSKNMFCEYIISLFIDNIKIITKNFLKEIVINFISSLDKNLKCKILKLADNKVAIYSKGCIFLDEEIIDYLYGGSLLEKLDALDSLFHEYAHHKQYLRGKTEITPIGYIEKKEHIIKNIDHNYYYNNYYSILFEKEAILIAKFLTKKYYDFLCTKEEEINLTNTIIYDIMSKENFKRQYNGITMDLNQIFDSIIFNNPSILIDNPEFNIEYELTKDNKVKAKDIKDIKKYIKENNISSEMLTLFESIYIHRIANRRKKT